jgi:hypothetical protein
MTEMFTIAPRQEMFSITISLIAAPPPTTLMVSHETAFSGKNLTGH